MIASKRVTRDKGSAVKADASATVKLAASGDRRAALELLRSFAKGSKDAATILWLRSCCEKIVGGTPANVAFGLQRSRGRPHSDPQEKLDRRQQELDRRHQICMALWVEIRDHPGRGKITRAFEAVVKSLKCTPREVRSAWEDELSRDSAKLDLGVAPDAEPSAAPISKATLMPLKSPKKNRR